MDVLPAQAASVCVERMFSSAADDDIPDRNRTSDELFEAYQVIRFNNRQDFHFKFDPVATEAEFSDTPREQDVDTSYADEIHSGMFSDGWFSSDSDTDE
jgi:hypothetical protein